MKTGWHKTSALSLMEVLAVAAILVLLASFALPMLTRAKARSGPSCSGNMKQIALGFHLYANDREDGFPWMARAGSREFTNSTEVFRHFQSASNEIYNAKILVCPADKERTRKTNFAALSNRNLSYFAGLDARPINPEMMLSGDRNIASGTFINPNLRLVRTNDSLSFTKAMHEFQGNIAFVDGSVQQFNTTRLTQQVSSMTNAVIRLAIP